MKIYVTKYALTTGILEFERGRNSQTETMVICKSAKAINREEYFHGNDWHMTFEAARDRAEEMRDLKINSLEKQTAKLRKMVFNKTKLMPATNDAAEAEQK